MDGEGARLHGGRWNLRGTPCVYLAESESLAILEVLVHLNSYTSLSRYALFSVGLKSEQILDLDTGSLPDNWHADTPPFSLARMGTDWLASGASLALRVPSAVAWRDFIILLNPLHPEFRLESLEVRPLEFFPDQRLIRT